MGMSNTKRHHLELCCDFLLIPPSEARSKWLPTMGQQSKKIIKRRRRADYLKRKKEQAKLGGIATRPSVKKADTPKKAPAAKKAAAKKAPAKKVAKKAPAEETRVDAVETAAPEVSESSES
jgi:hypothetical protein